MILRTSSLLTMSMLLGACGEIERGGYTPAEEPAEGTTPAEADPVEEAMPPTTEAEPPMSGDGKFKVMTFNVRYQAAEDTGVRRWSQRKASVFDMIELHNPDIFGLQETKKSDIDYPAAFKARFTGTDKAYDVIDPGGGSPKLIFFRKGRFELAQSLPNWGSENLPNPNESATCKSNAAGKKGVWAKLRDVQNDKTYFFVNTHLAFGPCPRSREAQAKELKDIIAANAADLPTILMGDMNHDPQAKGATSEKTIDLLASRGMTLGKAGDYDGTTTGARATFNSGWSTATPDARRIDYIFYSTGIQALATRIDKRVNADKITPSDHYPFIGTFAPSE